MNIFVYCIVFLGIINIIRMMVFFVAGYVYDIQIAKMRKTRKYYKPLVSVVIAAYNEERTIQGCLKAVIQNSYKKLEIIVVNDGSKDATSKKIQEFINTYRVHNVILIEQENGGKARALNNALINHIHGSLVMTLDADAQLAPDAIKNAVAYFQQKDVVAVAANVKISNYGTFLGLVQHIEYLMGYQLKKAMTPLNIEYIIGGVAAVYRKSILKRCHYYDTDTITEDIDFTLKMIQKGNKKNRLIYAADVICSTQAPLTLKALFRQRFRWKYGRFQTLYKNKGLFFNTKSQYSRPLTCLYLPFILFSEASFLLDPLLIGFVGYLAIYYQDVTALQGMFLFLGFYTFMSIITEEQIAFMHRIGLILLSPLAYAFFFIISCVEYIALLRSIFQAQGIINTKQERDCRWEPVERLHIAS